MTENKYLCAIYTAIFLLQRSSNNYIVVKDYVGDADGFTVKIGDIVEALEHDDSAK